MSGQLVRFYEFGPFCVDVSSRVLRRGGKALPLEPKVFDTLLVLVENHGKVVSKEELMKAVWGPDTFVEEGSIARNISLLRKTIDEGPGDTQCIATFPKRGYQFVATVSEVATSRSEAGAEGQRESVIETAEGHPQGAPLRGGFAELLRRRPVVLVAGGVVILALALGYRFVRPLPTPVVVGYHPLTHDGREKREPLLTDGARLYFEEKVDGKWDLAVVPTTGGDLSTDPLPSPNTALSDIAPDGANLLGWEQVPGKAVGKLLVWPVEGGHPEILGDLQGSWPTWSPDGARIAYSDGIRSVFVAGRHGENPRKVVSADAGPDQVRWLPYGNSLIFCEPDPKQETAVLLEVPANGGQIHRLLTVDRSNPYSTPVWTSAGDYSIFMSGPTDAPEIWTRRENCNPIRWRCREPARLTAAGGDYSAPLPSRDGKKLFVLGRKTKRELMRYGLNSRVIQPYLPRVLASDADFSRDGKWTAYVRLPERTLWRSRPDGSNATPLTASGAEAFSPHWSPDGKRIAYMSISAGNQYKACVVPAEGGQPQIVIPGESEEGIPTWSGDGNFLAFGDTLHVGRASKMAIHLLDLRNHTLSTLPGSAGLWTPRWSPDGRYIAALALGDETKGQLAHCASLLLYDFGKRSWTTLVNMLDIINVAWSRDSKCVYFLAGTSARGLYRVSLANKKIESLSSFRGSAEVGGDWIGVAPDGSPLVMMDTRIDEVYALDVQWP